MKIITKHIKILQLKIRLSNNKEDQPLFIAQSSLVRLLLRQVLLGRLLSLSIHSSNTHLVGGVEWGPQ